MLSALVVAIAIVGVVAIIIDRQRIYFPDQFRCQSYTFCVLRREGLKKVSSMGRAE